MPDNILNWPDHATREAWRSARRKRMGKPTERCAYLFFPRRHPIYLEAAAKAAAAVAAHRAAMAAAAVKRAATLAAKKAGASKHAPQQSIRKVKPTTSSYVQRLRETNYGASKQ